ncbi:hypothetical protein [Rossellomorea vietnamensis]|uniref:hypothetical protein n=1 Tax=Rossellomorea vietnamensis TaxID=218284 RepID=UPI001653B685|nr:hypothetical protein [Rossellomorea vietnamensis]
MISPDRQMFSREKKVLFPFILLRLFDPEGLGAEAGRIKSGSALISPDRQMFSPRGLALKLDVSKAEAP